MGTVSSFFKRRLHQKYYHLPTHQSDPCVSQRVIHVHLLHNASREAILDVLYDLRDNIHIQFGDNILIHFSGHGSSYDAESFFETGVSSAGSIETICPSDRSTSWEIPDISDHCSSVSSGAALGL